MARRSSDIRDIIISRLADGESLRAICRTDGMPNRSTIMRWLDDDADFATKYARAKDIGLDERAEKLADDMDAETDVSRAKLKFEYGRWYLSKLAPKKYGDKTLLGSDPENPLPAAVTLDASKLSTEALREVTQVLNATDKG